MSTPDVVFLSALLGVLLLECAWRLSTDAPPGPETLWLMPPWLLAAPLVLGSLFLAQHAVAFWCAALLVHRAWAAVLRVAPDTEPLREP